MQDLKEPKNEINQYQKAIYHDLLQDLQDLSQPIEYFFLSHNPPKIKYPKIGLGV
jgi:hypothetical protein